MKILFLTDNFPPEVNAPASRTFEHCREWARAGHSVTVITCAPNFPRGVVYDGYRNRLWQREKMNGIQVIRVWTYITANEGFLRRILDYISFMLAAILAAPFVRQVDIVVGTSPHFFTACAAYLVSRYKRVPFVFELRDLWPESIQVVGALRGSRGLRALEVIELYLYRKAARIVAVTHAFKANLIGRGVDGAKISVITNGVDLSRFQPSVKSVTLAARYRLQDKFVAGYIGTHGLAHALETVLAAAQRVRGLPDGERIHFLLLGDGARKNALMEAAKAARLDNVTFIDSVPKEEVADHWSLLDAAIIHLRNTPLFSTVIPSKLFEAMGMGVPVLHGLTGESADIVLRNAVGLLFEPENDAALCEALLRLQRDPGLWQQLHLNALAAAPRFDRRALALDMLKVLEATAAERKATGRERRTSELRP